tara:strand:+ start:73 stop:426 length:354 start_codon:yes stop_codon:yes gene_type:complete
MEKATKELLKDFGFADHGEFIDWSQTMSFGVRWHYDLDDGPKNFGGWPRMLVTDGDCGICLITSDNDEDIEMEHVGCSYSSIPYECIEDFRLAVDEADRDHQECLEEDPTDFFLIKP